MPSASGAALALRLQLVRRFGDRFPLDKLPDRAARILQFAEGLLNSSLERGMEVSPTSAKCLLMLLERILNLNVKVGLELPLRKFSACEDGQVQDGGSDTQESGSDTVSEPEEPAFSPELKRVARSYSLLEGFDDSDRRVFEDDLGMDEEFGMDDGFSL